MEEGLRVLQHIMDGAASAHLLPLSRPMHCSIADVEFHPMKSFASHGGIHIGAVAAFFFPFFI